MRAELQMACEELRLLIRQSTPSVGSQAAAEEEEAAARAGGTRRGDGEEGVELVGEAMGGAQGGTGGGHAAGERTASDCGHVAEGDVAAAPRLLASPAATTPHAKPSQVKSRARAEPAGGAAAASTDSAGAVGALIEHLRALLVQHNTQLGVSLRKCEVVTAESERRKASLALVEPSPEHPHPIARTLTRSPEPEPSG